MPQTTILIVDDEAPLRDFVRRNLEKRGYRTFSAVDGLEALAAFEREPIDLIILDVMMPNLNGFEVCRRIRQTSIVPIIVLTALGEEQDKITAFDLGADDYLTKPFGVGELLARLKAVLRRSHWESAPPSSETLRHGNLEIDVEQRRVRRAGSDVRLTPTEFTLLTELATHAGKVLTHRALLQKVWGPEYGGENEYLRVYINRLRQKLEADPSQPKHLLTEQSVGYRFQP
ncbi:KDP operon transcriptional regulatory protein KdpE [Thermoflexales bacterium]|nr:KDP operon transcriptional regulatory protein KdpE [Thermoflexales bacterium]